MEKEKARSGVAAPKQAKQESRWDSDVSRFKCTIEPSRGQSTNEPSRGQSTNEPSRGQSMERGWIVAPALLHGEENALSPKELIALCGIRSTRERRIVIAREREEGALILSTCRHRGGYFLPSEGEAGRKEIAAFVATLDARSINTQRALKTARRALALLDGQLTLEAAEGEARPAPQHRAEPR